jgi:hypothetical protein
MQAMTRRRFFRQVALVGGGVAAGSLVTLGGCKSGEPALKCDDPPGLTEAERAMRKTLAYTDQSPNAEKRCSNCQLYVPKGPNACGGCQLLKGTVHPDGYCTSWVQKTA